jgi:asparagine synthase (glutamine-hydrolysing)
MSPDVLNEQVTRMASTLTHRGPDDRGAWTDQLSDHSVALGFRRLSILDLSEAGHQPMISHSGRYVIVFNGEIYNFADIRKELLGRGSTGFRGHSDTEILLEAIEAWGFEAALQRLNGMFAMAVWDRHEQCLLLARDRIGEKPLYYGWCGETFLFGSELKAIKAHPSFNAPVDRGAIALLMRFGCVPAPYSIYSGFRKLVPGHWVSVAPGEKTLPKEVPYWSLRDRVESERWEGNDNEFVEEIHALLLKSVSMRMVADVPVGAFLSGGIDSSTIVALMQACSTRPVQTFTIGFKESKYNEAAYAAAVARHVGTEHTELYITTAEALQVIPSLPAIYDEPFADSSQIPTFLVSQLARRSVTVVLTGDGGDEVFMGYPRHLLMKRLQRMRQIPGSLRSLFAGAIKTLPAAMWDTILDGVTPLLPRVAHERFTGEKLHKFAKIIQQPDERRMLATIASHWDDRRKLLRGIEEPLSRLDVDSEWPRATYLEQIVFLDTITYLPDDILVKVDRATMANSLEGRIPFLDHTLVERVWQMPTRIRMRGDTGKWVLRQILSKYVPSELFDRPKVGFALPLDSWLRGGLRDWAEHLLDPRRLRDEGYLDADLVQSTWKAHLEGRLNLQHRLWNVLVLQAWLEGQDRLTPTRAILNRA